MVSDAEILAKVCRIASEKVIDPPVIDADTKLAVLKYNTSPAQEGFKPSSYFLLFDIVGEFRSSKPHWIWPDYFEYEKTSETVQTISDICKVIKDGYERMADIELQREEDKNNLAALKIKLKDVREVDLDELLHGNPSWEIVQKFFLEGEFCDERYLVEAIKLHLRTPEQKQSLDQLDLSIEDMLNGRYGINKSDTVQPIFKQWNEKLGFKSFGS